MSKIRHKNPLSMNQISPRQKQRRKAIQYPIQMVDVTVYPSICYKRVECRYSNESWTPGRVLEGNEVRCSMPATAFGSGITGTQELHLRIDKRGLFPILSIDKNVTFYNCSRYKSLEDCALSPFPCSWNAETTQCHSNQQNTSVSAETLVNLTWVVDYSQKAEVADGKLVIQYQAGEPILLNCEVPDRVPPSSIVYRVEYGNGTLATIQTFPLHGSRQVLAFLDDNTFGARLGCRAQFDGETFGSLSARIDIVRNEVSSTRSSFVYKNVDSLPSSFGTWCRGSCLYSVGEGVLDAAFRRFDFYTIRMNPPEIHFYRNGNTTLAPVVVKLPETRSMKYAYVKRAVMSVDPSGPQVMWTHAPGGHLWLTNVETRASVVLKKDFGAVEMSVDWSNDVVFGVSEKDSKCIFKVDLKNTSLITEMFVSEEITSLVVSRYYLFYLTGSGKIIQRDRENGIEWQVFEGYRSPNGRLKSLVADSTRTPYYFHWIQDFFGRTSIVYTMRFYSTFERPEQVEVSRHVAKELIGIGYQDSIFDAPCSCSHILQRHNSGSCVCGCPRGLEIRNETQCSGKWIHLVATGSQKPILMTSDLSKPTQTLQEKSSSLSGIKLIPHSDFGDNPCFTYGNATVNSANLVCWKNPSLTPSKAHFKIPVSADSILEVLTNPGSPELDVVFFEGVCIRILHSETNKTWTLFCGTMSRERGNILVDTESWISFWENGQDKSVYMTELDSLVTRRIIDARNFELEREVSRRLALDSNSKVLYWTHGRMVWRRSYKDVLDSKPELLWSSIDRIRKQLQFHEGFLYWIESIHGLDDSVVSFDIELKSKETLVTSPGKRFESFAVQSDTTSKSSSMKCNECSHFCKKNSLDETSGVCWCPSEKPILASNGTCHEPILHVVREPEAPVESAASSISRNEHEGCWSQQQGLVSNENQTETFLGSAFSTCGTKEVLPLGVTEGLEVFSSGSEAEHECGCITLTNAETGQGVGTDSDINEDRASPFAFDNRRQLAVWCTDRQLRFPKVDGSTADDSSEVHFADPCSRNDDKRCTSLALDEENGRAYFIYGNEINRLDYASNSSKPLVTTLHQMIYRFANSLSFDGKGHLFWAGGFADFGEFVDMIKVPENPGEMVVSVRVLNDWKNKIVQVQAVREARGETVESENPCKNSCFPASPVDKFALIRSSAGVVQFVDAEEVFAGGSEFLLDLAGKKLYTVMSREQDGTTSSTSSEPPETSELTTQTVHLDTDLEKSNWTTSNNLKYAATTSELLGPLKFTLRPGKPFFYLSFGGNATAQVRPWQ